MVDRSGWARRGRWACLLLLVCVATPSSAADEPTMFRQADELIVRLPSLDRLAPRPAGLRAIVRLTGAGGDRTWTVDLKNRPDSDALAIDLTGYGTCKSAALEIVDSAGRAVVSRQVQPVPVVAFAAAVSLPQDLAAIELGSRWSGPAPRIPLPDVKSLRSVATAQAKRIVSNAQITYPVVTDSDLPALSSANAVILSRQTFAPDDPARCSLYFSYRKGLFDAQTMRLSGYRKFLVEVPLDRRWLEGSTDSTISLPLDRFAIHTSDELERDGQRWNAPQGYPLLGESSTGLYQGGQTVDVDERGRIYISNVADGAGLIRFDPHQGTFEQPPVNLFAELKKLLPSGGDVRRSWDTDLAQIVCTRGRAYLVFARHSRVSTPNGKFETCSGVVSVPLDGWSDAEAFRRDVRLHAGCWPDAKPTLYANDLAVGETRRLPPPVPTEHGIAFGSWRLDLDDRGDAVRLVNVKSLADTVDAGGKPIPPTKLATTQGLPRQKFINLGAAGRPFLKFSYGEFAISRAALGLTIPGATAEPLAGSDGRFRSTYPGAPDGTVTVRFDVASKIRSEPGRYGSLAVALAGLAQGPNYGIIPVPGAADRTIGVCEYGYYFSELDFSRRQRDGKVFRTYLRGEVDGRPSNQPIHLGLGPYNLSWIERGDATWLYSVGYTGLARLKYAEGGRTLDAFAQEVVTGPSSPSPLDAHARGAVKDYLHLLPAPDDRLIAIGRGRPGRGGGAYSAALEIFDANAWGPSHTTAVMNRCFGLFTPVSRLVLSASGKPDKLEIYVAGGEIRPEYVADIDDPAERPKNQDPKVFVYDCEAAGQLADRFGFALPGGDGAVRPANLAFSPCRQYLVMLQTDGTLHTYRVASRTFRDGVRLRTAADQPVVPLETTRPSTLLWTAPDGRIFFAAATPVGAAQGATFYEIRVALDGRIAVEPHLSIECGQVPGAAAFSDIVRCFLPDRTHDDGSYDLVLGGNLDNGGQPTVRVIEDFVRP